MASKSNKENAVVLDDVLDVDINGVQRKTRKRTNNIFRLYSFHDVEEKTLYLATFIDADCYGTYRMNLETKVLTGLSHGSPIDMVIKQGARSRTSVYNELVKVTSSNPDVALMLCERASVVTMLERMDIEEELIEQEINNIS